MDTSTQRKTTKVTGLTILGAFATSRRRTVFLHGVLVVAKRRAKNEHSIFDLGDAFKRAVLKAT